MAILSNAALRERVFLTQEDKKRLFISPILNKDEQIDLKQASVDLRLGNVFVTQKRAEIARLDPWKFDSVDAPFLQEEVYVPFRRPFVLHPNQFVLGCTLEYLGLPTDLAAYVVGRSSLGRVGLVVATAIGIHPGYRGVITLELRNLAEIPLFIYPGTRICQAFFHEVEPAVDLDVTHGTFAWSTKPVFSHAQLPKNDKDALEQLGSLLGVDNVRPRID